MKYILMQILGRFMYFGLGFMTCAALLLTVKGMV